jgi:hypothetical protein
MSRKGGTWHAQAMLMQCSCAPHPERARQRAVEGRTIYMQGATILIRYARRR